jgi:hypothetical protein
MKLAFEVWMRKVDAIIMREMGGFSSEDLPDYDYPAAWRANDTPEETAEDAIEYAKGY